MGKSVFERPLPTASRDLGRGEHTFADVAHVPLPAEQCLLIAAGCYLRAEVVVGRERRPPRALSMQTAACECTASRNVKESLTRSLHLRCTCPLRPYLTLQFPVPSLCLPTTLGYMRWRKLYTVQGSCHVYRRYGTLTEPVMFSRKRGVRANVQSVLWAHLTLVSFGSVFWRALCRCSSGMPAQNAGAPLLRRGAVGRRLQRADVRASVAAYFVPCRTWSPCSASYAGHADRWHGPFVS